MTRWAPNLYRKEGKAQGIALDVIDASLRQAHLLQDQGLPPVLTLGHLAFQTNIPYWKLRSYVARNSSVPYRTFRIKKRSGGFRRICVPESDLRKIQRWINQFILDRVKASSFSYAFEKNQSIFDCAEQHLSCRWLIKIDLRNFFESLSEIQVYRVFRELGYQELVSFELARICTKAGASSRKYEFDWWKNKYKTGISAYESHLVGHLPQGAPTSPKLSNLIARKLDAEIADVANSFGLIYTRYADDMCFSTASDDFDRERGKDFIRKVFGLLPRHGLKPHPQKTNIVPPGARKIVLGLLVDGDKVRLSKGFCSKLECHWFYCSKDPVKHAERRGFHSLFGLKNYIQGLIAYANQVDPEYVKKVVKKYGDIVWPV